MFKQAKDDPAKRIERLTVEATDLLIKAEKADEMGWPSTARTARLRAAGKKAAATRIAREQGWS
jgi:hypothetical protein